MKTKDINKIIMENLLFVSLMFVGVAGSSIASLILYILE